MVKGERRFFGKGDGAHPGYRDHVSVPVVEKIINAAIKLRLMGQVVPFGSHMNSLSNANSDYDITYIPMQDEQQEDSSPVALLEAFAEELPSHGFRGIVRIYQASIPLIKAKDLSGVEVDLCIGNYLGIHNSRLVSGYCQIDFRVGEVCRAVKAWAKATELVGSSDGHLSSYAYTMLAIFYMMQTTPPVIPNLQEIAQHLGEPPFYLRDTKWGRAMSWDCCFFEDLHLLPRSKNNEKIESLLKGFFGYYINEFDWSSKPVSIRLASTLEYATAEKLSMRGIVTKDQWYIEDPFDLRHNLASNCTKEGRQRILNSMVEAHRLLEQDGSAGGMNGFASLCSRAPKQFLLKCRINLEKVSLEDFKAALANVKEVREPITIYWPPTLGASQRPREVLDAFLTFESEESRRQVYQLNESPLGDWQLRLLPCSPWALEDVRERDLYEKETVVAPAAFDPANQVRSGLREAKTVAEVEELVNLASTYELKHEEQLAKKLLLKLRESVSESAATKEASMSTASTVSTDQSADAASWSGFQ